MVVYQADLDGFLLKNHDLVARSNMVFDPHQLGQSPRFRPQVNNIFEKGEGMGTYPLVN